MTAAGPDRFLVLDVPPRTLEFRSADTGRVLTTYRLDRSGEAGRIAFGLLVGPDDVVYINGGANTAPEYAAYALVDGTYREVFRQPHGVGDSLLILGIDGIAVGNPQETLVPYVGRDGHPSGAKVDVAPLSATPVIYVADSCDTSQCSRIAPGPGTSIVAIHPLSDSTNRVRLTVAGGSVTSWDTDWTYAGPVGKNLLVYRWTSTTTEVGLVRL